MESEFNRQFCGDGRNYILGKDLYIRYVETAKIRKLIAENIREYIFIDAAVRVTVDAVDSESERLVISIPCNVDYSGIIANIADLIFNNIYGYYITADPKINHYGIANTIMEGFDSSTLRREIEVICKNLWGRADICGRFINGIQFEKDKLPHEKNFAFSDVMKERIDIHTGYRLLLYGPKMHNSTFFIPVIGSEMIIKQIYYNMEMILHHNFVTYDETADQTYLRLSAPLIMKELQALLRRAKNKENVRKKIVNNVKFATVITNDPVKRYGEIAGDYVYDTINQIDNKYLVDASDRSRALYDTLSIKTAVSVDETVNYKGLENLEDIIIHRIEPITEKLVQKSGTDPDVLSRRELSGASLRTQEIASTKEAIPVDGNVEEDSMASATDDFSLSGEDDMGLEEL